MAAAQKERSAKTAAKRKTRGEEELRMHAMAGTRQVLADFMEWHKIDEQGEAMTLALHHLHALDPAGSPPFFAPPRHEISVSKIVALEFHRKSLLMIQQDPGDEVFAPTIANRAGALQQEL